MTNPNQKPDDGPVQEARTAKALARHRRSCLLRQWTAEGHVTRLVPSQNDAVRVAICCGDQTFVDLRSNFPSEALIARIQLAIHAGQSGWLRHSVPPPPLPLPVNVAVPREVGFDRYCEKVEQAMKRSCSSQMARLKQKLRGLRP